jgi:two-component system chemotaxis response regulator CheB
VEYNHLLSALTIHFTNFFREHEQFEPFLKLILDSREEKLPQIRILVAACSTGEEPYSLGLVLERYRRLGKIGEYKIVGIDIDAVSVSKAQSAIYSADRMNDIPLLYRPLLLVGSGKTRGFFTFDPDIRSRIRWLAGDLRQIDVLLNQKQESPFDGVTCRNILIYFNKKGIEGIVDKLLGQMKAGGVLALGHSETIDGQMFGLTAKGRSLYVYKPKSNHMALKMDRVERALVIDDSPTVRRVVASILEKAGFEVESVESAAQASQFLAHQSVDLISLDLNMPVQDGASWLRQQRASGLKTPVVIISDATPKEAEAVLGALLGGAQDYIFKQELSQFPNQVGARLKAIADQALSRGQIKVSQPIIPKDQKPQKFFPELIVIGASTGGTEALVSLLGLMPVDAPPVMVVQHITVAFAKPFAQRLSQVSGLKLAEPKQDLPLMAGHLYMATEDYHIAVRKSGGNLKLNLSYGPPEHSVRPAVDVLFRSVAREKIPTLGAILTGMGKDGALGLLELKQSGAYTIAQDEASCVVFGMPREAQQMGAVHFTGNIRALRLEIDQCLSSPKKGTLKVAS